MKHKLLLFSLLCIPALGFAQYELDFESAPLVNEYLIDNNGPAATPKMIGSWEDNPVKNGINTSNKAIKDLEEAGAKPWAYPIFQFGTGGMTLNATDGKFIKLKILSTNKTSFTLTISPWIGGTATAVTKTFTGVPLNTWFEAEFDYSAFSDGYVSRLDFFFDKNAGIYYIDDLSQQTASSITNRVSKANGAYNAIGTWINGVVPSTTDNSHIVHDVTNAANITAANLIVSKSLDVTGNLTTTTNTIHSGGSLKVSGTVTGDVNYNVGISDTNWHLISAPVSGEGYDNAWVTANSITSGQNNNRAIATYQNGAADLDSDGAGPDTATGQWVYMQAGASGTFGDGIGYSLKRTTGDNYSFTGSYKEDNLLISIDREGTNYWNLVGNPYPSYLLVSEIIGDNSANLTDSHEFIYVWDNNKVGGAGYTQLAGTDYIHPGQAFFVNAANSNANNFTITEARQSIQTGVTLYKSNKPSIRLFVEKGTKKEYTDFEYSLNATASLDRGMDAGTFTGVSTDFSVYSHLVSESEGVDFMKQVLPNSNFESMVIPVGLNSKVGEITFSTETSNLPQGINVYLEDRLTNTFTRLDKANSSLKITLDKDLNGIGRFYLHTKSSALSSDSISLENISIFNTNDSTLRIVGLSQGKSTVKLFNILGKQVMSSFFQSNGVQDISIPKLARGVYLVQLETEKGKLNKKIILE